MRHTFVLISSIGPVKRVKNLKHRKQEYKVQEPFVSNDIEISLPQTNFDWSFFVFAITDISRNKEQHNGQLPARFTYIRPSGSLRKRLMRPLVILYRFVFFAAPVNHFICGIDFPIKHPRNLGSELGSMLTQSYFRTSLPDGASCRDFYSLAHNYSTNLYRFYCKVIKS